MSIINNGEGLIIVPNIKSVFVNSIKLVRLVQKLLKNCIFISKFRISGKSKNFLHDLKFHFTCSAITKMHLFADFVTG